MHTGSTPISDQARILIDKCALEAKRDGLVGPTAAHVFLSISTDSPTTALLICDELGIDISMLQSFLLNTSNELPLRVLRSAIPFDIFSQARACAQRSGFKFICTEHVLWAALEQSDPVVELAFRSVGMSVEYACVQMQERIREKLRDTCDVSMLGFHSDSLSSQSIANRWRRIEESIYAIEKNVASHNSSKEVLHAVVRDVSNCLAAYGAIAWDMSDTMHLPAIISYGVRPKNHDAEARKVAHASLRHCSIATTDVLLLFQKINTPVPLLLQILQRPVVDDGVVRGYYVFLERVAQCCEQANLKWQ